jgi:hypothetical protein
MGEVRGVLSSYAPVIPVSETLLMLTGGNASMGNSSKAEADIKKETHSVHDNRFDGRVVSWERQGLDESVDMLAVEELVTTDYASLTSDGVVNSKQQSRRRAEIREEHAFGVLVALADYFDYEIRPK